MIKVSTLFGLFRKLRDKRFLTILLLVICSSSPYILQGSVLSLWLNETDLSPSTIGIFAAVTTVYVLNWTWAPFVGRIRLPIGYKLFGQWGSWVLLCQTGLAVSFALLSFTSPVENLLLGSVCALVVAISSEILTLGLDRKYWVWLKYSTLTQDKLCR